MSKREHFKSFASLLKEKRGKEEIQILTDLRFDLDTFSTGHTRFVSKDPDKKRKIAILDSGEPTPDSSQAYDVEIIRDTQPFDKKRGAFIVRIREKGSGNTQKAPKNSSVEMTAPIEEKKKNYVPKPIERDELTGKVYILETELPINPMGGEKVPRPEQFTHFTLDERTLETAEKIATATELQQPCLLEGETSTSKTSTIEYVAMMTNNEVARLNLNGQTDTSELIGKFVPNDGQLQISFEDMLRGFENLSDTSKHIVTKAREEMRALTLIESQHIAEAEHLKIPEWHWQDGIDVEAKRKGQWLILDEINLAEPQILERLNPQLERHPSITLSENGGTVIRELNEEEIELHKQGKLPGVEPLHPNFRIFGTMNPAEYTGRQPMSPAYKDRWTGYKFVQNPTAKDYSAMINLMVYGKQPTVTIRGQQYEPEKVDSMLPTLEKISGFHKLAEKIAKFQEAVENLARKKEIGRNKKEPYVFTRRGLIEFLTYLEKKTIVDRTTRDRVSITKAPKEIITRGITFYYLDKIANQEDRQKVVDQLDIIGISESNWTHRFW